MLKVYNYRPDEMGMKDFPSGTLRLIDDFTEQVDNPDRADVFCVPPPIHAIPDYNALKYLESREKQHVFFSGGDFMHLDTPPGAIAFRMECTQDVLRRNPSSIAWPWPTPRDTIAWRDRLSNRNDVFFHGWVSSNLNRIALDRLEAWARDYHKRVDFRRDNRFYGFISEEEQQALRLPFLIGMSQARLTLSVRSIPTGVIRYRYYEAMSMGRCIIHINDGCVYPLADRIDYDAFTQRIPEDQVYKTDLYVDAYLNSHGDTDLYERGMYALNMWDKWLDHAKWPATMAKIVREKVS